MHKKDSVVREDDSVIRNLALAFCEFVQFGGGFYDFLADGRSESGKVGIGGGFFASSCWVVGVSWLMLSSLDVAAIEQ